MKLVEEVREVTLSDGDDVLYGSANAAAMAALSAAMLSAAARIAKHFYIGVSSLPRSKEILDRLTQAERQHLEAQQMRNLVTLAGATLTESEHRQIAMRIGRIHATLGLDHDDLTRSREILASAIRSEICGQAYNEALHVLSLRLARDLAIQTEAYQQLQAQRNAATAEIARIALSPESYASLITGVTQVLGSLDELAGCAVLRPDREGVFLVEAAAGARLLQYFSSIETVRQRFMSTNAEVPQGQGPTGLAWRTGKTMRVINIATDPCMTMWAADAQVAGVRSHVAIPVRRPDGQPHAILTLYSDLPGGFSGADQRGFVSLLQTLLELAVGRVERAERDTDTTVVPYVTRRRWSALLRSDALQMYYQPILDLRTGEVVRVEALARLQDGERTLAPGQFFAALSPEDFLELYMRGLAQSLSQRNVWLQAGIDLGISVNLPPSAMCDSRYFEVTQMALAQSECEPAALTLEILETEEISPVSAAREIAKYRMLGVRLAQDDLGAGHSSLSRLRGLPFDGIKIDRSLVDLMGQDGSSDALRFVYQLTRLGQSLGKSVVVEGVEELDLLEALKMLGVDLVQGYGIARPMPAAEIAPWLAGRPRVADVCNPESKLAKLARLLLWEEGVFIGQALTEPWTNVAADAESAAPAANGVEACSACLFGVHAGKLDATLPLGIAELPARQALVEAAVFAGTRSEAYRSARQMFVAQL